ncbi:RNA polymerase sigma factor [Actinomadura craniellae]|uniref:RNA polymerase sigma factor n=1 Tax=Actinomadura craniellae TaxID=2231787 RepID=UPI001F214D31|nr:sigma-70 family RNA polymerase sigma factor [Actinomadura craniellae]
MTLRQRRDDTGELVTRAAEGDPAAWTALVDRYTGLLWAIARSYGLEPADASDVVQTTWLRLVERIGTIRDPAATGGWLAVTARHESARTAGRRIPAAPYVPPPPGRPDEVVLARERLAQVAAALRALPSRCRSLLRLFALAPAGYAEVAAALDIPVGSVGPTRARCLAKLRRRLAGEPGER